MTRPVNIHKQSYRYLNTNKLRQTQTIQKSYIRKKTIIQPDEFVIEYNRRYRQNNDILKEMSNRLRQIEKKSQEIVIIFIEHSIGRKLTEEEKQKILVYV